MNYDGLDMTQISDGLSQTAACAAAPVYDRENGLMFVSYMTGLRKFYGESTSKLCMSIFPPSQPTNIRHRMIDPGIGETRGLLCTAHYLIGDRRTRVMFTTTRGEKASYYRDYDFETDTVSERTKVFIKTAQDTLPLVNETYHLFLNENGYHVDCDKEPIINKVCKYNGAFYTAITLDGPSYPILCRIEDNILVPFAICPEMTTYEFRYLINDDGIFGVFRVPPDDHKTGHGGYTVSADGGKTWRTSIFADGIQSRPDVMEYYGKPLVIYNYRNDSSLQNWPPMHNFRNAIKMVYDGKVIKDIFSKYGIVEHETISINGDLYMTFSNCPQALSTANHK
ncbi:MAG: hypothetical protein MJ099_00410, partial [Clostridia bacterium]|nr:hypothetical protein [Clostridia bacterium]